MRRRCRCIWGQISEGDAQPWRPQTPVRRTPGALVLITCYRRRLGASIFACVVSDSFVGRCAETRRERCPVDLPLWTRLAGRRSSRLSHQRGSQMPAGLGFQPHRLWPRYRRGRAPLILSLRLCPLAGGAPRAAGSLPSSEHRSALGPAMPLPSAPALLPSCNHPLPGEPAAASGK